MKSNKLVTIGVITYNSGKYVIETLDSIYRQTYDNIELIISDDCSTDDTISLCEEWLSHHSQRFVHSELIKVSVNTGTSANCNRILKKCQGYWLKLIAGDDLLFDNAITEYLTFVESDANIVATFADSVHFKGKVDDKLYSHDPLDLEKLAFGNSSSAKRQFHILCKKFIGSGPTFFIRTDKVKEMGGYDERFRLQEDYPLFLKLTRAGYKLHLLKKELVYKRVTNDSVQYQKTNKDNIFGNLTIESIREYKFLYKYENMNRVWRHLLNFSMWLQNKILDSGNRRSNFKSKFYFIMYRLFDPIDWYSRLINQCNKLLSVFEK